MWSGYVSPIMRQKAKGSRPKRNAERRAARRLVLPGFPISPIKFSKVEVDQYFSGDRIQCLVCGKTYRRLARHLDLHSLTEDDYRELYGLPWRRGLCGTAAFQAHSAAVNLRIEQGFMPPCDAENRAKAHEAIRQGHVRYQPFMKEVRQQNVAKSNGREPWPDTMYAEIVRRVMTIRSVPNVCQDDDVPGMSWFRDYAVRHPAEKQRFLDQLNELPYPAQGAIGYGMGKRFWSEVIRRRLAGESDHVIARATGVSAMTSHRGRRLRGIA